MLKVHIERGKRDKFYFEITLKYNICSINVILYLHIYLQNMIIPLEIAKPMYTRTQQENESVSYSIKKFY